MRQQRRPAGHFAGIQFFHDKIDKATWRYRLGPVEAAAADMASIEAVLTRRAEVLGATIRRGCAVKGVQERGDEVLVSAGDDIFSGRWLVGCDGAHSAVRKSAGIGFTGTDPEFTGYSVRAALANPDALAPGRHQSGGGVYTFEAPDVIAMADFDGGAFHRSSPITREHVEAVLRKVSGADVRVESLDLAATWTDRSYQATEYRKGRVLLAGDAAHIHSPLGGQGLNLGLADAMNLGWKLAGVIRGDAPSDLLESYQHERHPVGAQILDWSRAQVALMRPQPSSRALRAIVHDIIETRDGATYFAERALGIGLRYDLSGSHPLIGRSAPDFHLSDGTRLNQHLRAGRGLLVAFDPMPKRRALARQWHHRLDYLETGTPNQLGLSALLLRPDGFVAWAIDAGADESELAATIMRWFGLPSHQ
jgi:2-polyprenyl-6-methoxyphenol hydroxylase-like FAD-dependent oxidoreductase